LRCHLCPDGLGRVADISCGGAWERLDNGGDAGRSIAVVRTERGREFLHKAIAAQYVKLEPVGISAVRAAQPNRIQQQVLRDRLLAMRLLFVPVPKFAGFSVFNTWSELPF